MAEELQVAAARGFAFAACSISLFDYHLPKELIAQEPITPRDAARLLLLERAGGTISHRRVRDLGEFLTPGDLLVFNNTRVVPARLYGVRERTGGKWEGLFLRATDDGHWELMSQTRGRLEAGEMIRVASGRLLPPLSPKGGEGERCPPRTEHLRLHLVEKTPTGHWIAQAEPAGSWIDLLEQFGHVPLPPYIRKGHDDPADRERYQTVFAHTPGAVAAPTAGLHFTPELFADLQRRGIHKTFVTLHVGAGTFRPIEVEDVRHHAMHQEWGELSVNAAEAIVSCKERGGRVIAVGTTSVRVLETVAERGLVQPWAGETDLYIHPPYQFKVVDALLTNFHLPKSSLFVLVSAFAGIDIVRHAYQIAIAERYRFYSYGDAMLIL